MWLKIVKKKKKDGVSLQRSWNRTYLIMWSCVDQILLAHTQWGIAISKYTSIMKWSCFMGKQSLNVRFLQVVMQINVVKCMSENLPIKFDFCRIRGCTRCIMLELKLLDQRPETEKDFHNMAPFCQIHWYKWDFVWKRIISSLWNLFLWSHAC